MSIWRGTYEQEEQLIIKPDRRGTIYRTPFKVIVFYQGTITIVPYRNCINFLWIRQKASVNSAPNLQQYLLHV